MKKNKIIAGAIALAMTVVSIGALNSAPDTYAAAKPKLNVSSKTIAVSSSFKIKVKKVKGMKSISKTTWTTSKKNVATLKKAKKTSVTVTAKSAGQAKITAKVKYKLKSGKSKTKKLICKVTVTNEQPFNHTSQPSAPVYDNPGVTQTPLQSSPTPKPTLVPYENTKGYYAGYNGVNSKNGNNTLYVNYVMTDSKEVNKLASAVNKLEFKIDSKSSYDIGIYVSEWDCNASALGDDAKVASFTTDGTVGQEVSLDLSGSAIDSLSHEKISFGFYSEADKSVQVYCLHDMYVGYGNKLYPVNLTELNTGCTESSKDIYQARKKDTSIATSDDYTSLCELTSSKGYKFGTVVSYESLMSDKEFCKLVAKHCDSITAANEFKAYSLLDQQASQASEDGMPAMNYTNADAICEWAKENNLKIRGHALVWDHNMTQWFFNTDYADNQTDESGNVTNRVDKDTMRARLASYIEQVITHFEEKYPGVIYCWDVVNEGVDPDSAASGDKCKIRRSRDGEPNPFYYCVGDDYVQFSFKAARDTLDNIGNTSIDLVYNDYNVIYSDKRTPIINLVKAINSYDNNRKLCDTVGMQGYLGYGQQSNCLGDYLVSNVTDAIKELSRNGVKVQLTEMAMRNFVNTEEYEAAHAEFSKKLFTALADINTTTNNAFTSMSIWAFIDNPILNYTDNTYDYDITTPYSGLFDEVYTPKASFNEIYTALGGELPE